MPKVKAAKKSRQYQEVKSQGKLQKGSVNNVNRQYVYKPCRIY